MTNPKSTEGTISDEFVIAMLEERQHPQFHDGARWGREWEHKRLMKTVDGLSMAERVAASIGFKRGCERVRKEVIQRDAEITRLKEQLAIATEALEYYTLIHESLEEQRIVSGKPAREALQKIRGVKE